METQINRNHLIFKRKMLIRIDKDWGFPDVKQQSPASTCKWGDFEFTFEPVKECDLLISLNPPNKEIKVKCPPGNKWLFTLESPIDQYKWHIDSFEYFDKVFTYWDDSVAGNILHEQTALPWHIGRSYDQLMALTREPGLLIKKDAVSWVTSNATHKEGHKLRMGFKDYLIEQGFSFDLFGRGFNPIDDKFDGIYPYKYSLAIENYPCNDYWTEKIADCFLSWTVPIYWGCKNILSYFPEKSIILIDPSDPQAALKTIQHAIDSGYYHQNLDALAEARDLVLNKYQLFPHVSGLIKKYGVQEGGNKKRSYIPKNKAHGETRTLASLSSKLWRVFKAT